MSAPLLKGRARARQQLVGLVFLVVIAVLVGLTVAVYNKTFVDVVTVELKADRIGNQMSRGADVKARGLIVGEVREVRSTGDGATLVLALQPDKAEMVRTDVRAQLLPKTLFGEKFVALQPQRGSTAPAVRDGDVIAQDQSETARETAKAVDDLLPLLRTLGPREISTTLNALSGALRGRGDQIGDNLERTGEYLRQFNPELPALEQDFRGIADVVDNYDDAAADLLAVLDNLSFSSRSVVDQSDELEAFLRTTTTFSDSARSFLDDNEVRLTRLAADSLPSLKVYERYSPEFGCFFNTLNEQQALAGEAFGVTQRGLHITLEVTRDQNAYLPGDEPQNLDDSGPTCYGLDPDNPIRPFQPQAEVDDGYCDEEEAASPGVTTGDCRTQAGNQPSSAAVAADPARFAAGARTSDRAAVALAVAPVYGTTSDRVPDIAELLFGPLSRGTTVRVD